MRFRIIITRLDFAYTWKKKVLVEFKAVHNWIKIAFLFYIGFFASFGIGNETKKNYFCHILGIFFLYFLCVWKILMFQRKFCEEFFFVIKILSVGSIEKFSLMKIHFGWCKGCLVVFVSWGFNLFFYWNF